LCCVSVLWSVCFLIHMWNAHIIFLFEGPHLLIKLFNCINVKVYDVLLLGRVFLPSLAVEISTIQFKSFNTFYKLTWLGNTRWQGRFSKVFLFVCTVWFMLNRWKNSGQMLLYYCNLYWHFFPFDLCITCSNF